MPVLTLENFGVSLVVIQDFEGVTPLVIEVPAGETVVRTLTTDVVERLAAQLDSMSSTLKWWSLDEDMATPVQDLPALRAVALADRTDKQTRLVEDTGGIYRFDAEGTGADDGENIIVPDDVTPPDPGRWFKVEGATQNHEDLTGLQGGSVGDHKHLTAAELAAVPTADEKAALAGTFGTPSATNPVVTYEDPGFRGATTADLVFYANSDTGDDANDGLSLGAPKKTLEEAGGILDVIDKLHLVAHRIHVHLDGVAPFKVNWDRTITNYLFKSGRLFFDGGPDLVVVADDSGSPWVSDTAGTGTIGLSSLVWTENEYQGNMVEITDGPAAGELSTIGDNTTGGIITPVTPFLVDPTVGAGFRIVRPKVILENVGTAPFDFDQHVVDFIGIEGSGNVYFQRLTITGFVPFNVGTGVGKNKTYLAACVLDKPFTFYRIGAIICKGGVELVSTVYDPDDLDLATILPLNHAGVGEAGGDGTVALTSINAEWMNGRLVIEGSFIQRITGNSAHNVSPFCLGSRIKQLYFFSGYGSTFYESENTNFGGFKLWGSPTPTGSAVSLNMANINLKNCDLSGSQFGLKMLNSQCVLNGNITGTNLIAGACVRDHSVCCLDPAANVTVTGPLGDLTFDEVSAYPGGWAAAKVASPPAGDPNYFGMVRVRGYRDE